MLLSQGSAAGGHCHRHVGKVKRDHIGVALDDHRLAAGNDRSLGAVEAVEQAGFVIDRGLG